MTKDFFFVIILLMPRGPVFASPSKPSLELLSRYAPAEAWLEAIRQATRSPMGYYGTGAVLLDRSGGHLFSGCAHPSPDGRMASTHAERHCLRQASHLDLREALCLVYTRSSRSGGCAWTSRPCFHCARALVKRGVRRALYPRRREDGSWSIEEDDMCDILEGRVFSESPFARALSR